MNQAAPQPAGENLIYIREVTKLFGSQVELNNISLAVPEGQVCGLLGPNGAGKTTLFRLLMGIFKPTSGTLLVSGLDAFDDKVEVKRLVGYLPDDPVFYSYLSGREVLELSAAMHGLDTAETMDRVMPLIARLRLDDDLGRYAEEYSRGMKKKLGLILAMLHDPRLLILDEPTNGLDVESTHEFYELMREESLRGKTVLFSTHLMDHVSRLCSHVAIINEGSLVARGSLEDLGVIFGDAQSLEEVFLKLTKRQSKL